MTATQADSAIPTGSWQSDPIHSSVGFAVKQVVGTFRGGFEQFDATLSDQGGEPRLSGRAKAESVQVKEENLYSSLLAPDFFDAERYPEIAFESNQVSRDGDKVT